MIVGIAGKIASGKSTLTRSLAARLKAKRLGFGDYVRVVAKSKGSDPSDRKVLQLIGQELATRDPSAFVGGILSFGGYDPPENIVFDGIRHGSVWQEIQAVAARIHDTAFLVFLDMPEEMRQQRLAARGLDRQSVAAFDGHPNESDLEVLLRETADLTLDARLDDEQLVDRVLSFAEKT
jgi:dephospho-CoA kinase